MVGPSGKAMKVSDAVGTFAIVFVLPEDIALTSGSPKFHLNFLDVYLCQFSRKYLLGLLEYRKILKQRNALLKKLKTVRSGAMLRHLDSWDRALVKPSARIMAARRKFIEEIRPKVGELASRISGSADLVEIHYTPRLPAELIDNPAAVEAKFGAERERDIRAGTSTLGPHRDTIKILVCEQPLRSFGSMGQKKSALIAMKLAVLDFLSKQRGEPAILVLDEAFAALDPQRSRNLMQLLSNAGQVFLASASSDAIDISGEARIFDVNTGTVSQRGS